MKFYGVIFMVITFFVFPLVVAYHISGTIQKITNQSHSKKEDRQALDKFCENKSWLYTEDFYKNYSMCNKS